MGYFFKKRTMKPRDIREKYGVIANTNCSSKELIDGVERQWKRFNDPEFQEEEFKEKIKRVFPSVE